MDLVSLPFPFSLFLLLSFLSLTLFSLSLSLSLYQLLRNSQCRTHTHTSLSLTLIGFQTVRISHPSLSIYFYSFHPPDRSSHNDYILWETTTYILFTRLWRITKDELFNAEFLLSIHFPPFSLSPSFSLNTVSNLSLSLSLSFNQTLDCYLYLSTLSFPLFFLSQYTTLIIEILFFDFLKIVFLFYK